MLMMLPSEEMSSMRWVKLRTQDCIRSACPVNFVSANLWFSRMWSRTAAMRQRSSLRFSAWTGLAAAMQRSMTLSCSTALAC